MSTRLIIEGNSVYEIDEECLACSKSMEQEGNNAMKKPGDKIEHKKTPANRKDRTRR